jgi:hypothetical protein
MSYFLLHKSNARKKLPSHLAIKTVSIVLGDHSIQHDLIHISADLASANEADETIDSLIQELEGLRKKIRQYFS